MQDALVKADCLEYLKSLPDESVDVVFADPPFNLNKKYASYKDKMSSDAYLSWCKQWLIETVRVVKPTGSIFVHNIPKWLTFYAAILNDIATFRHWIAWEAMSTPRGKGLYPTHYGILFYAKNLKQNKMYQLRSPHKRCRKCGLLTKDYGGKKKSLHPFGPLTSDVWTDIHRVKHFTKQKEGHPCALPTPLLERLILMSTDVGDIVLDPFVGTGSTAVASKRLDRHWGGCDMENKYINLAKQRIDATIVSKTINGVHVGRSLGKIITIRDKDWEVISQNHWIPSTPANLEICSAKEVERTCLC